MTDVKSGVNLLFLRDEELRQGIELLHFVHRDFIAQPDAMLAELGYGRAHQRAIYFVGRHPAITVGDLQGLLSITKQGLARILGQLLDDQVLAQRPDPRDRRKRLLVLTDKGAALERQLTEMQRSRIARAYREAGAEAVEGFRKVMLGLIDDSHRRHFPASGPVERKRGTP